MSADSCGVCGGDGRLSNSFGLESRCPGCSGSGRRGDAAPGVRDVTKTKPSHYRTDAKSAPTKAQWPVTSEGGRLATEVRDSASCTADVKARIIRDIIEHEGSHGNCTQTFQKKVRRQLRPGA